eukprot:gene264-138_t
MESLPCAASPSSPSAAPHTRVPPALPVSDALEAKIEAKLREMTLEEKIGQMLEILIQPDIDRHHRIHTDPEVLEQLFDTYKIGSTVAFFLGTQPPETWRRLLRAINQRSCDACRGIPQIFGVDQNHGSTFGLGGTLFPQEINQGATFNVDAVRRLNEITAYEARACLFPWVYNPVMDLGRQPLWPRMYESYGEDVCVNAEMGVAAVRAYQGEDPNNIGMEHVAACMKHYMAYGVPVSGKDRTPSSVTDREMREKFFEPFRRCVEAGALTVRISSGINNGLPFHANKQMIQGWLKDELNWDGMVLSDWADLKHVWSRDHLTETYKEAIAMCVNAGIDMVTEPHDPTFCDLLKECVEEGLVSRERIDDACRRILRLKYRVNLMDKATWDMSPEQVAAMYPKFGCNEFADEAEKMTEESMVLLKNETPVGANAPVLPLKRGQKILVCGPNANSFRAMAGGWSFSFNGDIADDVCRELHQYKYKTFYEGIRGKFGSSRVKLVEGVQYAAVSTIPKRGAPRGQEDVHFESEVDIDYETPVEAAADADVIVVCIGENSYACVEGNANDLSLSCAQLDLVYVLAQTGKPVVLVLNEGRPRIITEVEPYCCATIATMLPGVYGGVALANLLAGDSNFSGKLPFTYPRSSASLMTYDYKPCHRPPDWQGIGVYGGAIPGTLYPFGYGLSYTTFQYSNLTIDKPEFKAGDELHFSVKVKNTGAREGKEAVLLYTSDLVATITPDIRRLRAFTKISLQPGEEQTVRLAVKGSDLAFVGYDNHWVLEKGAFVATCGGQFVEFCCAETRRWDTPNRGFDVAFCDRLLEKRKRRRKKKRKCYGVCNWVLLLSLSSSLLYDGYRHGGHSAQNFVEPTGDGMWAVVKKKIRKYWEYGEWCWFSMSYLLINFSGKFGLGMVRGSNVLLLFLFVLFYFIGNVEFVGESSRYEKLVASLPILDLRMMMMMIDVSHDELERLRRSLHLTGNICPQLGPQGQSFYFALHTIAISRRGVFLLSFPNNDFLVNEKMFIIIIIDLSAKDSYDSAATQPTCSICALPHLRWTISIFIIIIIFANWFRMSSICVIVFLCIATRAVPSSLIFFSLFHTVHIRHMTASDSDYLLSLSISSALSLYCSHYILLPLSTCPIRLPLCLFLSLSPSSSAMPAQRVPPALPVSAALEAKIEAKLREMTLEEKIGQMLEILIQPDIDAQNEAHMDPKVLEQLFDTYKIGSILAPLLETRPPEVWVQLTREINQRSFNTCRGIPQIFGVDQNHGSTFGLGGTLFPQEINQGATFNVDAVRRLNEITAYEARACLFPWVYNPVMDLGRQPLWPRMYESYGEDVCVNAEMGAIATKAYQGEDPNNIGMEHVAACMKHYMAYGVPVSGKDRTPSSVTDREMREKFFEPFRRCVEAGALSVMINSAVNNGLSFHANKQMIQGWLKDELNWDGMVITDFADIRNVWSRDHLTETYKEAIAMCVNAGIDMIMEAFDVTVCDLLKECVEEGLVSRERIDDACRRILRLKYRVNLMDKATWDMSPEQVAAMYPKFGGEMTEESMVLLKNETPVGANAPVLPMKRGQKILVCGPNANSFRAMAGGWTFSHQGHIADRVCRQLRKYKYKTFYEGIRDRFGADHVRIVEGVSYQPSPPFVLMNGVSAFPPDGSFALEMQEDIASAVEAAKEADVIIACVGENSYCEFPGNIDNLLLSPHQLALVGAMIQTGKPVVLVLNEGRPRLITDVEPMCTATIATMLPGVYGGVALANLLAGDVNFSGKLPFTYPKHSGALATYDYKPCQSRPVMEGNYNYEAVMDVLYPFGYGLSYTTFQYSNLTIDKPEFKAGDELHFSVRVKNTGAREGKEAVLLYTSDLVATITPDIRRLRAFTKISLQPGEEQTVRLAVKGSDLAFVGYDNHWVLEKGAFVATCGGQFVEFCCAETRRWDTPNRIFWVFLLDLMNRVLDFLYNVFVLCEELFAVFLNEESQVVCVAVRWVGAHRCVFEWIIFFGGWLTTRLASVIPLVGWMCCYGYVFDAYGGQMRCWMSSGKGLINTLSLMLFSENVFYLFGLVCFIYISFFCCCCCLFVCLFRVFFIISSTFRTQKQDNNSSVVMEFSAIAAADIHAQRHPSHHLMRLSCPLLCILLVFCATSTSSSFNTVVSRLSSSSLLFLSSTGSTMPYHLPLARIRHTNY